MEVKSSDLTKDDIIGEDEGALQLINKEGNFLESLELFSCKSRFRRALQDIVDRHLV